LDGEEGLFSHPRRKREARGCQAKLMLELTWKLTRKVIVLSEGNEGKSIIAEWRFWGGIRRKEIDLYADVKGRMKEKGRTSAKGLECRKKGVKPVHQKWRTVSERDK